MSRRRKKFRDSCLQAHLVYFFKPDIFGHKKKLKVGLRMGKSEIEQLELRDEKIANEIFIREWFERENQKK